VSVVRSAAFVLLVQDTTGLSSPLGQAVGLISVGATLVVLLRWWWHNRRR
jgi:hypothetical protein